MPRGRALPLSLAVALAAVTPAVLAPAPARADVELKFGGMITSDIRYRVKGAPLGNLYPEQLRLLPEGFSRNDNLIKSQLTLRIGEKVKGVADADLWLYGYSDVKDLDSLTLRERVDPYRLEVNAAYIDVYKLLPGLDVRVGRQIVAWGSADQFNPTNNVNSVDLSDPLLFGKALANNMVRFDYNFAGDFTLTGVVVPIFRPSQLPRTAIIALSDVYRPLSVQDENVARNIYLLGTVLNRPDTVRSFTILPESSLSNVQTALKLSGRILDQDVSLSWYRGRFSFPVPAAALFHVKDSSVDVGVTWPRMDVLGADIGGTIEPLGGMGYWIEAAVIFPQPVNYTIYSDTGPNNRTEVRIREAPESGPIQLPVDPTTGRLLSPAPADTPPRWLIHDSTPFLKITIGGDMSLGQHVYLNLQYVHGFPDEFGSGWAWHQSRTVQEAGWDAEIWRNRRIGDYLVGGLDLKFLGETIALRAFGVLKLPSLYFEDGAHFDEWRPTGTLLTQLGWKVWDGTEINLGGLVFLGDRSTKFGDPATGASELFLKAKFAY